MAITTLLFDLGGVCLSNGWDHEQRQSVARQFGFDYEAFDSRHQQVVDTLERGQLSLDEYLKWTLFYQERPWTIDQIKRAIFELSTANEEMLNFLRELRDAHDYTLCVLNNESSDLNKYRIDHFKLCDIFSVFFTSCYLDMAKPHPDMYRRALDMLQREPDQCVFVDDRPMNCEVARIIGIPAIQFKSVEQLKADLTTLGVRLPDRQAAS